MLWYMLDDLSNYLRWSFQALLILSENVKHFLSSCEKIKFNSLQMNRGFSKLF